jgi:fructose-1,6-bisphosphatase/sedoheptulose 1,7-bisphosphatase-like protein
VAGWARPRYWAASGTIDLERVFELADLVASDEVLFVSTDP